MKNMLHQLAALLGPGDVDNLPTSTDGSDILAGGLNLIYFITGVVAVIVLIIAGIMYVASNGDQNSIERAKNMVLYSVVGLIVIVLAFAITQIVIGRFA